MICTICGKNAETRYAVCLDCATAESIIHEGTDMYDKGLNQSDVPAKSPMEKLRLLIENGWIKK